MTDREKSWPSEQTPVSADELATIKREADKVSPPGTELDLFVDTKAPKDKGIREST